MIKLVVVWNPPENMSPEAFDRRYFAEHVPLARSIPGVRKYLVTKFLEAPDGSPARYYRMAELYYDTLDAVRLGRASAQSQAARQQIVDWKWRDVHFMIGDESEQALGS